MEKTPHLGQITINAIVYKQMPDGSFNPESIWHDSFSITFLEENAQECIDELKKKLEGLKNGS